MLCVAPILLRWNPGGVQQGWRAGAAAVAASGRLNISVESCETLEGQMVPAAAWLR